MNHETAAVLGEELLELTKKRGISEAEVYLVTSYARPVFFEANRLKQLESSQSQGIALRLWKNNCPGLAVAYGSFNPEALVEKAIAISQLNPPEIPELAAQNSLIYPPSPPNPPVGQLIELGEKAIAIIRELYPEVICSVELNWEVETTTLINSKGLHCQHGAISQSYSLGVEWIRGDDFLGIYDGEYTREGFNLDKVLQRIIRLLDWGTHLHPSPLGKIPVLLTPNAATILWETAADALNGKAVADKSSPWSDSLGEEAIASQLTLTQNPDLKPHDCPFDDEGTPTQPLTLIDRGRIASFYCDRRTGKKLGKETTGNGFRPTLASYPTPDLVNLIVAGETNSASALIGNLGQGLIVEQIMGDGADLSGDFSLNVELGYRVENGEVTGRVKDTMIAGNVYSIFRGAIALGDDFRWSGCYYTPSVLVPQLSVVSPKG